MKQAFRNFSALIVAAAFFAPATLLAQKEEKDKEVKEKKAAEQIIITRKGEKNEKLVIEIDGDKVIVNGKAIEDLKDGDITVRRNRIRDVWAYADGLRGQTFLSPVEGRSFMLDSNRAMLGVTTEKSEKGVEIQNITKESAASKAGLKKGDIITKIGDQTITDPDELSTVIKKQKPGDKVTITYLRDNKEQKVTTELGKWKGATTIFNTAPLGNFNFDMGDLHLDELMGHAQTAPRIRTPYGQNWNWSGGSPKLGLSIQDTDDGKGVKVIEVDDESNAAKAGLKEDDLITEVNGKAVNSADEVAKIIRESKDKTSVTLKLKRDGKTQNVEVKMPRRLKTADL